MKKLVKNILLIVGVLMACNIDHAMAVNPLYTCQYHHELGEQALKDEDKIYDKSFDLLCNFYAQGELCYIEDENGYKSIEFFDINANGKINKKATEVSIKNAMATKGNLGSAQDYIEQNNACPPYLAVKTAEGYEVYAAYSEPIDTSGLPSSLPYFTAKLSKSESSISGTPGAAGGTSDISDCAILGDNITPIVKWLIDLIDIAIPIIIIIMTIVDFTGVVLSGEEKNFKAAGTKLIKRLIIGAVVILLPMLLAFIIDLSGVLVPYGIGKNQVFCSLF